MLYQLIFVVSGYSRRGLLVFLTLALAACGGGGGSDSGNGGSPVVSSREPERPRLSFPDSTLAEDYTIYIADEQRLNQQELYIARAGSVPRVIATSQIDRLPDTEASAVVYAKVSPTKQIIGYVGDQEVNDRCELFIVSATSEENSRVSNNFNKPGGVTDFTFSNNGRRIAYALHRRTNSTTCQASPGITTDGTLETDLFLMNANGDQRQQILPATANTNRSFRNLAYSATDTFVAYVSETTPGGDSELVILRDQDPDNIVRIQSVTGVNSSTGAPIEGRLNILEAKWSSTSDIIAFRARLGDSEGLFTASFSNPQPRLISGPLTPGFGPADFVWEPQGSRIAYLSNVASEQARNYDVFVVNSQGGESTLITPDLDNIAYFEGNYVNLAWSNNSETIAYLVNNGGEFDRHDLYLSTTTPGSEINVTENFGIAENENSFDVFPGFSWTLDDSGRDALAFAADGITNNNYDLYTVEVGGGTTDSTMPLSQGLTEGPTDDVLVPQWTVNAEAIQYLAGQVEGAAKVDLDLYQARATMPTVVEEARLSNTRSGRGFSVECFAVAIEGNNSFCNPFLTLTDPH